MRAGALEARQHEAAGVPNDRLEPRLALRADRRAVDREADRLADGELVGRPHVEVRLARVCSSAPARTTGCGG